MSKEAKKEIRISPMTEFRVSRANGKPMLEGYAALFNSWSQDLGGFVEKVAPGAFRNALKNSDARALFNHDPNFVLGRESSGTLTLKEDNKGLFMVADPPETQWARDLMVSVERGDINQMSWGFTVESDEWSEDKKGQVTRIIHEVRSVLDASVVTYPAYPDTTVAVRKARNNGFASIDETKFEGEIKRMRTHFQKKNFERADRFLNQREPSPTEFCRYVAQAGTAHDGGNYIHYGKVHPSLEHLRTVSGLSEGVSSEAGFLAPGGWTDRILNHKWGSKIYQLCNLFKIEYNSMKMPHLDDTDRQNGLYKNFVIYPVSEASAITDTTLKFVANNLDLKKFVGLGAVTDELLQDFASLEQFLFDHFGRAFGWDIDRQIIRGAGHLEMLGLINSPAKIRIGKETGQDAATVLAENVKKMDARLVPEAHNTDSTVVLIHQTVKPQLIGLTETVGTAGGATPLYQFKRNGEQFDRLLGHPVIVSEHCSTIGSEGDIIFCSLDRFLIIQRAIRKQTSSHWLFLTDESAFRCVLRIDGQMDIAKPITPYGGGDTVSAVVTLADRS